jgi:hypothetical protein
VSFRARLTHPWWWRQYAPLKRRSTIILHGSATQKTALNTILSALITYKKNYITYLISCWAIHDDSRSNWQRWNRQNRYYHPVRSSKLGIHSQDITFFICYMPENLPHPFSTQTYFFLLGIFINVLPLSCQIKASSSDVRLVSTTASMSLFARLMKQTNNLNANFSQ